MTAVRQVILPTLAILMLVDCASVQAAQTGDSMDFNFTGRLYSTACSVNNDQMINIEFDNVGVHKVASGQYVRDIHYTLNCQNASPSNTVSMVLRATPAGFDTRAMNTSVSALGVYILNNGNPVALNTAIPVDPDQPLKLQAKLVKDPATDLPVKSFVATGTLVAEYK